MKKIDSKLEKESILQIIKTYLSKNLCKKSPRWGVGGCTFCDYRGSALGCFSTHLGVTPTFCAQLQAAMEAIEIAHRRGWNCLWLECDSSLVVQTYGSHQLFPWWLRTHCLNCQVITRSISFVIFHIFREGNECVDHLTNFGVTFHSTTCWDIVSDFLRNIFFWDRIGLPNYRFS